MKKILVCVYLLLSTACAYAQGDFSRDASMEDAQAYRLNGEFAKAKNIYDQVLSTNETDADALVGRGYARLQNKELYNEALQDFDQVINLAPTYVDAYLGKATILKRMGKWRQAKTVLQDCYSQIQGDPKAVRYLAEFSWQEGFWELARSLDNDYPPEAKRHLMDYKNEITLNYGYDWLDNRSDWQEFNFTYSYRIRPDQSVSMYYSDFRRDQDNDFLIGLGYLFKWNYFTTLAYDAYVSDDSGFTADQKHRPRIYLKLPQAFVLGLGGNFDEFTGGWARVFHTELAKYYGGFFGKYTILAGEDNLSQTVTTHIGEMGYEKENEYTMRLGYSTGNESLERIDRIIDSSIDIDSYFLSGKYFVTTDWGINFSVTREYRNSDFFRTTGSTSVFYRF